MSIALLSGVFVTGCKPAYGPDVVAIVNGHPIQRSEVEKSYRDNLGNNKEQPTREQAQATRLGVLKQLIDEEILQQAAKKMTIPRSSAIPFSLRSRKVTRLFRKKLNRC